MRIKILLVLAVLLATCNGWAATITTAGSGDYSSTTANAPWPSGTIPDPATDTVVVGSGHTLTISDTRTVPAITISNGAAASDAVLVLAATAVVTAGKIKLNGGGRR